MKLNRRIFLKLLPSAMVVPVLPVDSLEVTRKAVCADLGVPVSLVSEGGFTIPGSFTNEWLDVLSMYVGDPVSVPVIDGPNDPFVGLTQEEAERKSCALRGLDYDELKAMDNRPVNMKKVMNKIRKG